MKRVGKLRILLVVAALLILLPATIVFGDAKGTLKGEVTGMDDTTTPGSLTIETEDGEVITFDVPEDFVFDPELIGKTVLVKIRWFNDTDFQVEWIKQVGPKETNGDSPDDGQETGQNAFCTDKKDSSHPLAMKIVAKYGDEVEIIVDDNLVPLDETMVMEWFCEGHSFGQIMLALTTNILDGSDPYGTLLARKDGQGWGKIWKDKGLIGNEREGMPPGWVKKPDKPIPPGLESKTEKVPPGLLKKTPTP